MSRDRNRVAAFDACMSEGGVVAAPGVHDALSGRIAAAAGHRALYLGGNAMALGLGKGQPFLTVTETAAIVGAVSATVDVPLLVDAGAGFGDASHVDGAVRQLEWAGAAAIHIDDQRYPKTPDYHRGRGTLVDAGVMARRIATAIAARSEMRIIARTDALRVTGSLDAAIDRARLYRDAGAEALIVLDLTPEQVPAMRAAVPGLPLLWIGGVTAPVPTLTELSAAGFAMALYPFSGVAAVLRGLDALWRGLAENGSVAQDEAVLAPARAAMAGLADLPRAWAVEEVAHERA